MRVAVNRDRIQSEFTGWITALERTVLKKDRFLGGLDDAVKAEAPCPEPMVNTVAGMDIAQQKKESTTTPAPPGPPLPQSSPEQPSPMDQNKSPATTVFGEKLQAVLQPRK
jgi:hypothetical protein